VRGRGGENLIVSRRAQINGTSRNPVYFLNQFSGSAVKLNYVGAKKI
jgi:hypothetical protein